MAIVDPPYGIGAKGNMGRRKGNAKSGLPSIQWDDVPPPPEYFTELFRVSKNQIIWGANHFISLMPFNSPCWLVWDKWIGEELSFAQVELAWTSFSSTAKKFTKARAQEVRIHPTQKPVALYKWLLSKFGNGGGVYPRYPHGESIQPHRSIRDGFQLHRLRNRSRLFYCRKQTLCGTDRTGAIIQRSRLIYDGAGILIQLNETQIITINRVLRPAGMG